MMLVLFYVRYNQGWGVSSKCKRWLYASGSPLEVTWVFPSVIGCKTTHATRSCYSPQIPCNSVRSRCNLSFWALWLSHTRGCAGGRFGITLRNAGSPSASSMNFGIVPATHTSASLGVATCHHDSSYPLTVLGRAWMCHSAKTRWN